MPSNIYNEGRVVGYSAYEIYVRHSLSEDPERTPASEIEWLSSTVAMGSSMLLKISAEDESSGSRGHHSRIFCLPENSNLAAANTIVGSLFLGTAECDGYWASKITSYGPLLTNNLDFPVPGDHSNQDDEHPSQPNPRTPLSETGQNQILNYMKIVDGIVIQPGEWFTNGESNQPPIHDFSPKFNGKNAIIKLYFSDRITEDFYILFTGFTLKSVLHGVSGMDGSTDTSTNMWENGGFLGPAVFPWANKIVFSVPPSYVGYFLDKKYYRKMSKNGNPNVLESSTKKVERPPVIDMETTDPATYYTSTDSDVRVPLTVFDLNNVKGDAVLTVYQRSAAFPPALYGTKVDTEGSQYANPIDTVAPNTLKLFDAENRETASDKSKDFEDKIPKNHALFRDTSDYVLRQINHSISSNPTNWVDVPVADTYVDSIYGSLESSDVTPPYFAMQTNSTDPARFADTSVLFNRRIRGKVSDQFRQDFGIDPATPEGYGFLELLTQTINAPDVPGARDSAINKSMLSYISSIPNWKSKYFFIVQGNSTAHTGYYVSNMMIVPVAKPEPGDVVPSNTFDYTYKAYGPRFKIPVLLPTSTTEANRSGSFGQYVGGYYQGEGPTTHETVLEYLRDVLNITPVALMDYARKVPNVDGYTDWQDAYRAITVRDFVTAVRNDAVEREVIDASVTVDSILNGNFSYTYTDTYGNSRTVIYDKIHTQYWDIPLIDALETSKFYNMQTGEPLSNGLVLQTHYVPISDLELTINGTPVKLSTVGSDIPDWSENEDLRFNLTQSEPSDWSTRWKYYYTRTISSGKPSYHKIADSSAPSWVANKYYALKYELTEVTYSTALTLTTSVQEASPTFVAVQWPTQEAQEKYAFTNGPLNVTNIAGLHQTKALSVADKSGKTYDMSGENGAISDMKGGNIHWDDLLNALVNNKALDIVGAAQKRISAGFGISIRKITKIIDGQSVECWEIVNDRPNIDNGVGYTTLEQDRDFKSVEYNGFVGYDPTNPDTPTVPSPPLRVSILPSTTTQTYSFNDNGQETEVEIPSYINISISVGSQSGTRLGKPMYEESNGIAPIRKRGFFIGDGVEYKLITDKPSNWDTHYTNYYKKANNVYTRVPLQSEAPSWANNTYYTRTSDTNYKYTLTTARPYNWGAFYTSYYTKSGNTYTKVTGNHPPDWRPNTYYKQEVNWNRKPGFRFYHTDNIVGEFGVYGWIFGLRFLDSEVTLVDGTTLNLTHVRSAFEDGTYKFRNTTSGGSGIWNVGMKNGVLPRASWQALTNMYRGFFVESQYTLLSTQPINWETEYTQYYTKDLNVEHYTEVEASASAPTWQTNTYYRREMHMVPRYYYHPEGLPSSSTDTTRNAHIFAASASYADGYNAQFNYYDSVVRANVPSDTQNPSDPTKYVQQHEIDGGKYLWTNHLNMTVSCMLYL